MHSFSTLLKQCRPARHAVSQQEHDNLRRVSVPESDGVLCGSGADDDPANTAKGILLRWMSY